MTKQPITPDDLTAIRGIGPARQRWLADEFAVRRYDQLAALLPEEIEARLKASGKVVARAEIAGWLEQARALASANATPPAPQEEPWTPAAAFVVEYQKRVAQPGLSGWRTVAHYVEADLEQVWPGVEIAAVGRWLAEHVPVPEPEPEPEPELPPPPVVQRPAGAPLALQARQVRIRQTPGYLAALDAGQPAPSLLGHIQHDRPISVEVDLEPLAGGRLAGGTPDYLARFQLHNLSRGEPSRWLEMRRGEARAEAEPVYRSHLDVELAPGLYELSILVTSAGPSAPIYWKLPKLNVL